MLTGYFPGQWIIAKIILHLKPGKPPNEPMSYRPISLLPILSKVYENLLLHRLLPIIETGGYHQTICSAFTSYILQYTKLAV
jgi:hypothetical protein